jgi:hypothetical protein
VTVGAPFSPPIMMLNPHDTVLHVKEVRLPTDQRQQPNPSPAQPQPSPAADSSSPAAATQQTAMQWNMHCGKHDMHRLSSCMV